ncbi:uncharacterized protein LOC130816073 [Amaranthus tricolor]|uniref:uncharacterized protein LOC130816073 n=1 Tax=Amaranthus tricolor TaxID=29722 RepID=UPI002587CFB4|nr:uncharacterized protein LOC130816073 [Amaranthus tricolor]
MKKKNKKRNQRPLLRYKDLDSHQQDHMKNNYNNNNKDKLVVNESINFQTIDEDEPVRQHFLAIPPPSGGGTGSFNKHLAKKHGITKETHAASGSGTTSGSRQWDIPSV